jgi:hypothetical protein
VMSLVRALDDGTNKCRGYESGDTHYAARVCVKRQPGVNVKRWRLQGASAAGQ